MEYKVYWSGFGLNPGESAEIEIWICTTLQGAGKFHPTSGDDGEDTLPLDKYAEFGFDYEGGSIYADGSTMTESIHFVVVNDDEDIDNWGQLELYDGTGDLTDLNASPFPNWPVRRYVDVVIP